MNAYELPAEKLLSSSSHGITHFDSNLFKCLCWWENRTEHGAVFPHSDTGILPVEAFLWWHFRVQKGTISVEMGTSSLEPNRDDKE